MNWTSVAPTIANTRAPSEITISMSDGAAPVEAGGPPAQGGGGGGGGGSNGGGGGAIPVDVEKKSEAHKNLHESVKQMRITKSVYDVYVSGDATPLSRPLSRHSIELDDYFVSV